ncbi:MAG: hypothetical protein MJ103_09920 [Saccharofermentans sp.]|nr:hypothetical protein [Saccharofermentans sp.]
MGKLSPGIIITDYPDVIAQHPVNGIIKNTKNGRRIEWLTGRKAALRFMTAGWNKRDFFTEANNND